MKKTFRTALSAAFLLLAALLIAGTASAGTPGGAGVTAGSTSTNTSTSTAQSNQSQGGYITQIDVTTTLQTANWTGYYGNVTSGTIVLKDSAGYQMYSWTGNVAYGGYVYATNKTSAPAWANLIQISATTLDNSSYWNWGSKSDNISNTYNLTETRTFAGKSITNAAKATMSNFNDYVISDNSATAKTAIVWAGAINNDASNFKSTLSDYELLVPVGASEVYYFYLEIA